MALRNIFEGSSPRLRTAARPVREINDHIVEILDDLIDTLAAADGVGLAAPQIGINRRIAVIQISDDSPVIELINPEIVSSEGEQTRLEGCLSFPGTWGEVVRPAKVSVKALDRSGTEQIYEGEGLLAQALTHELDHLDGVLFVDKVTRWFTPEEMQALTAAEQAETEGQD